MFADGMILKDYLLTLWGHLAQLSAQFLCSLVLVAWEQMVLRLAFASSKIWATSVTLALLSSCLLSCSQILISPLMFRSYFHKDILCFKGEHEN